MDLEKRGGMRTRIMRKMAKHERKLKAMRTSCQFSWSMILIFFEVEPPSTTRSSRKKCGRVERKGAREAKRKKGPA